MFERHPPAADFALDEVRFAVVDVETTGGSFGQGDRITEIAVVQVDRGEIGTVFSTLLNPGRPIPPMIQRFTGINDRMVAGAPSFHEVAGLIVSQIEGRIFTAHNARFDWAFIQAELASAERDLLDMERLCTVRMGRFFLPDLRRHGLDSLADFYRIPVEGRHRAMGDALATARLLLHLLDAAREQGISEWGALRDTLQGRKKKGRRRARRRNAATPTEAG